MAAQTAHDLELLFEQRGLHVFKLDLGDMQQYLIASVDSFVSVVKPLLAEFKPKLRTSLARALQELAAQQIKWQIGTDHDLMEPSVTLLNASSFLNLFENEGIAWTCADKVGRTATLSALEAKGMQSVAQVMKRSVSSSTPKLRESRNSSETSSASSLNLEH